MILLGEPSAEWNVTLFSLAKSYKRPSVAAAPGPHKHTARIIHQHHWGSLVIGQIQREWCSEKKLLAALADNEQKYTVTTINLKEILAFVPAVGRGYLQPGLWGSAASSNCILHHLLSDRRKGRSIIRTLSLRPQQPVQQGTGMGTWPQWRIFLCWVTVGKSPSSIQTFFPSFHIMRRESDEGNNRKRTITGNEKAQPLRTQ